MREVPGSIPGAALCVGKKNVGTGSEDVCYTNFKTKTFGFIILIECINERTSSYFQIRGSIVVSISACHAEDPGSIPGRGVLLN